MPKLSKAFPIDRLDGIFTVLGELYPEDLTWAVNDGMALDVLYIYNHSGNKETSPLIDTFLEAELTEELTHDQVVALARIIYAKYGVTWGKLYNVLSAQYDPIENYSMVEEETPDITMTETPNVTRDKTTTSKSDYTVTSDSDANTDVYGFNSSVSVPQAESGGSSTVRTQGDPDNNVVTESDTETGTRTHTETGKRTLTRSGNIGVTTSQQMLESEIALWKWNFYDTIFKDVDMVLTVPKYNY